MRSHITHTSLGLSESITHTASRSVQPTLSKVLCHFPHLLSSLFDSSLKAAEFEQLGSGVHGVASHKSREVHLLCFIAFSRFRRDRKYHIESDRNEKQLQAVYDYRTEMKAMKVLIAINQLSILVII